MSLGQYDLLTSPLSSCLFDLSLVLGINFILLLLLNVIIVILVIVSPPLLFFCQGRGKDKARCRLSCHARLLRGIGLGFACKSCSC